MPTPMPMQKRIFKCAQAHGWWDGFQFPLDVQRPEDRAKVVEKLALIHSEVSEALEELRDGGPLDSVRLDEKGKPLGFPTELADIIIRVLDLAEACGIDTAREVERKVTFNESRPFRHGGKLL